MPIFAFVCVLSHFWIQPARADAQFSLQPIVMEGTAGEALQNDPILPAHSEKVIQDSSSGNIGGTLKEDLPLPLSNPDTPGAISQFRGLGRSSEDVSVEVFGIPLNPAQGGGFNLSVFPQFVWSDYQFQAGPALGAGDPRTLSGTLSLVPWSVHALKPGSERARSTATYSSTDVTQVSAAARTGGAAVVAGYSFGDLQGPAGAFSGGLEGPRSRARLHLLAADTDAKLPGSASHLVTTRLIPVAQADFDLGKSLLKTAVFYDRIDQRFTSPLTHDVIHHFGTQEAYFFDTWEVGLAARSTHFQGIGFSPPSENVLNLQLRRTWTVGTFTFDPVLKSTWVTGFEPFPEASFGVRDELAPEMALYTRLSHSRRIPSLTDRYYVDPFFVANPALGPERDWTLIAGIETGTRPLRIKLEGFAQWRDNAQLLTSVPSTSQSTVVNRGAARIYAATLELEHHPLPWLELKNGLTYANSEVTSTGEPFSYLPDWVELLVVRAFTDLWEAKAIARASQRYSVGFCNELPGYGTLDLEAGTDFFRPAHLAARLDNVWDRPVVVSAGLPPLERAISVLVSGTF